MDYLWDGNRQLQETTDTHQFTTIYEQDSFEPVARLVWLRAGLTIAANDEPTAEELQDAEGWYGNNKPVIKTGVQLYHYHNDHLGTPNELTDQQGEVVWYADYEAWGNTATVEWKEQRIDNIVVSKEHLQPIRFQGQSFDEETGLHYNRFRYFDPDLGMFTTRDPIGLLGGSNVFQYAPNPTGWIDPFGLSSEALRRNMIADQRQIGQWQTPHHIVQEKSGKSQYSQHSRDLLTSENIHIDNSANGAALTGTASSQVANPNHPGRTTARQNGNYHAGQHLHGPDADKNIYRILRSAQKKGKIVENVLRDIGRRMEAGTWRNSLSACTGKKY